MNEFTNKNYVTHNTYRKPERFGDRNHVEDDNDDFRYLQNRAGELAGDIFTNVPVLIFGGAVVQGTGDTLDITAGNGYVAYSVEVAGDFTAQTPPATSNEDITTKVSWTLQDDMTVPGATLDGATTNYVKVKYKEASLYSRVKAEAAGSYDYKKEDSFEFVVDAVAPTAYELCLKTFTGAPAGSWTFADYTGHWPHIRGQQDSKLTIEADSIIDQNQALRTDAVTQFERLGIGIDISALIADIKAVAYINSSAASRMLFQNQTTGTTAADGFSIGISLFEEALLLNQESTDMIFSTSGIERMKLDDSESGALLVKNGISSTDGQPILKEKIIEIGDWDMLNNNVKSVSHGLSDSLKIRNIDVMIRNDANTKIFPLQTFTDGGDPILLAGGVYDISSTTITLARRTGGGIFPNVNFDSTSYNRGWIYIKYEV